MLIFIVATALFAVILFLLMLILQSPIYMFIAIPILLLGCLILRVKRKVLARIALCVSAVLSILLIALTRQDSSVSLRGALVSGGMRFAFTNLVDVNDVLFAKKEDKKTWEAPDYCDYETVTLENCRIELLNGNSSKKAVYFIHGGAFINNLTNDYRKTALFLTEDLEETAVALIDYRTQTEAGFPSAIDDVAEGYQFLLNRGFGPEDIVVLGDSAGANLGLELIFSLREKHTEMPAGLILISAWADMTESGASYADNARLDPLFSDMQRRADGVLPKEYFAGLDLNNPKVSPVFGDYSGFPETLLQVGSYEILKSDSETIYDKCIKAGVNADLSIYEGMFHVFPIICGKGIPESKQAWDEIEDFIKHSMETKP